MEWSDVGGWLVDNATTGGALVGSIMTGNVPGAIAAGASLVQSATGEVSPKKALAKLQSDPATMVRLAELENENDADIRLHSREVMKLKFEDEQKEHETTQKTIQNGDNSDKWWVSITRPGQSWLLVCATIGYVFYATSKGSVPDPVTIGAMMMQPLAYAGLRTRDKFDTLRKTTL